MPQVSVLTMCYWGYVQYLSECLHSVANQTYRDFEHIVLGIEGDEDTKRVASGFPVRYLPVKDCGLSTGRNYMAAAASAPYLVNLDADDWAAPSFLERLVERAALGKIICPGLQSFGEQNTSGWFSPPITFRDLQAGNKIFYASLFAKHDWLRVGGYDPALDQLGFEDYELWLNLTKHGCEIEVVPELLLMYRVRQTSHYHRTAHQEAAKMAYIRSKHG